MAWALANGGEKKGGGGQQALAVSTGLEAGEGWPSVRTRTFGELGRTRTSDKGAPTCSCRLQAAIGRKWAPHTRAITHTHTHARGGADTKRAKNVYCFRMLMVFVPVPERLITHSHKGGPLSKHAHEQFLPTATGRTTTIE